VLTPARSAYSLSRRKPFLGEPSARNGSSSTYSRFNTRSGRAGSIKLTSLSPYQRPSVSSVEKRNGRLTKSYSGWFSSLPKRLTPGAAELAKVINAQEASAGSSSV
jgi:hypothetical protein